jgi:hypothetical protein
MALARNAILARGVLKSGWAFWPIVGLLIVELVTSALLLHIAATWRKQAKASGAARRTLRRRAAKFLVAFVVGLLAIVGLGFLATRGPGGFAALFGVGGADAGAPPVDPAIGLWAVLGYLALRLFGWVREIVHAPIGEGGLPVTHFGLLNGFHILALALMLLATPLAIAHLAVAQVAFFVLRTAAEVTMAFTADVLLHYRVMRAQRGRRSQRPQDA